MDLWIEKFKYGQIDKYMDRQINIWIDINMNRQIIFIDIQIVYIYRYIIIDIHRQKIWIEMYIYLDGFIDRKIFGQIDRWMDIYIVTNR